MSGKYDDIIHLPHHVSAKHPQMPIYDRAAQFSPFAALTGYDAAVKETARLTDQRAELDESAKALLDMKLQMLSDALPGKPEASITYFQPDVRKDGGAYLTVSGTVKKLDEYERTVVMTDGKRIPIDDVFEIEGELFKGLY